MVRDAGGGILASTIASSTTVAGGANQTYTAVAPTQTSGNGSSATFDVTRDAVGDVLSATVTTGSEGYFYAVNDTVTLPGASVGGAVSYTHLTLPTKA